MNDNTTQTTDSGADADTRILPETSPMRLESAVPAAVDVDAEGDRNPVFSSLVTKEGDVVGLIAYSIYKQNKHDWLLTFRRLREREPTPAELTAYIIGESTGRRLSTYRYLASATLAGQGPDIAAGNAAQPFSTRGLKAATPGQSGLVGTSGLAARILGFIALAAVVAIAALLGARYGLLTK